MCVYSGVFSLRIFAWRIGEKRAKSKLTRYYWWRRNRLIWLRNCNRAKRMNRQSMTKESPQQRETRAHYIVIERARQHQPLTDESASPETWHGAHMADARARAYIARVLATTTRFVHTHIGLWRSDDGPCTLRLFDQIGKSWPTRTVHFVPGQRCPTVSVRFNHDDERGGVRLSFTWRCENKAIQCRTRWRKGSNSIRVFEYFSKFRLCIIQYLSKSKGDIAQPCGAA